MKYRLVLLLLLFSSVIVFAGGCVTCTELLGMPQARLAVSMDEQHKVIEVYASYENMSASPPRQPISDSIIIIELSNSTGLKELYKTYTDSTGKASFDFSDWGGACVNFRILYCPFCDPEAPTCGFKECLNYSGIETNATNASEVEDAPGASPPSTLNTAKYLPELATSSYCAPPPPMAGTPAICLPLLIIFSVLGGALYLSGRNPFAAFNIGGQRMGKHLRYQPRGRGFSFSVMAAVQAVSSIASAATTMTKGYEVTDEKTGEKKTLKGVDALVAQDQAFAQQRGPGYITRRVEMGREALRAGGGTGTGTGAGPTSVATPGGTGTMAPGTPSGPRTFKEIIGSGAEILIRLPMFFLSQTILGRTIDGFVGLATYNPATGMGRGLFDIAFIDRTQRVTDGLANMAALQVVDPATDQAIGVRAKVNGQEVVIMNVPPPQFLDTQGHPVHFDVINERGQPCTRSTDGTLVPVSGVARSVLTVQVTATGSAQPLDGRMQIVVAADGRIESMSYQRAGVVPAAPGGEPQNGTVIVSVGADGTQQVLIRGGDGTIYNAQGKAIIDNQGRLLNDQGQPIATGTGVGAIGINGRLMVLADGTPVYVAEVRMEGGQAIAYDASGNRIGQGAVAVDSAGQMMTDPATGRPLIVTGTVPPTTEGAPLHVTCGTFSVNAQGRIVNSEGQAVTDASILGRLGTSSVPAPIWEELVFPAMMGAPAGLRLGGDGSALTEGFGRTSEALRVIGGVVAQDAREGAFIAGEEFLSGLGSSPAARELAREVRGDMARETLELGLGYTPGTLGAGGQSELFQGLPKESSAIGEQSRPEVALERVAAAAEGASFTPRGITTTVLESDKNARGGSALTDTDRAILDTYLPRALASMSVSELRTLDAAGLQAALVAAGVPAEDATRVSGALKNESYGAMQNCAATFTGALLDQGLGTAFVDRLSGRDLSQVGEMASAGRMMDDAHLPQLLASTPSFLVASGVPENLRQDLREYNLADQAAASAGMAANAFGSGQISLGNDTLMRAQEQASQYLEAALIDKAERAGDVFAAHAPGQLGPSEYTQASTAVDMGIQTGRLETAFGTAGTSEQIVMREAERPMQVYNAAMDGDWAIVRTYSEDAARIYANAADAAASRGDDATATSLRAISDAYGALATAARSPQPDPQAVGTALQTLCVYPQLHEMAATTQTTDPMYDRVQAYLQMESDARQSNVAAPLGAAIGGGGPTDPAAVWYGESSRRQEITDCASRGDWGTAGAMAADGYHDYMAAADAARARHDQQSAELFEATARGYGQIVGLAGSSNPSQDGVLTQFGAMEDPVTLGRTVGETSTRLVAERSDTLLGVRDQMEQRLHPEQRGVGGTAIEPPEWRRREGEESS